MKACMFTAICQEDAHWIPQYVAEAERLDMPYAIHLDRCSPRDDSRIERLCGHRLCVGATSQPDKAIEFTEQHKQGVLDLVVGLGFDWAVPMDCDETWEKDAPRKFPLLMCENGDYIDVKWVNLWDDPQHIRVDGFLGAGHRVKFINLRVGEWRFCHPVVNGPKLIDRKTHGVERHDVVCLHWGVMTHAMRVQHKERWDRIYTKAVGANPYGFWNSILDPNVSPEVVRNPYL